MNKKILLRSIAAGLIAAAGALGLPAHADDGVGPAAGNSAAAVEVGFSPDGSARALVLRAIGSARRSVRLAAYMFYAAPVARALAAAKKRGVDVAVVVDYQANMQGAAARKARAALHLLVAAGIPTRAVALYPVQHSKYAVIDDMHVQTGSYNYTTTAARYNSENVVVLWNRPDLARAYLANWQRLFDAGQAVQE